MWTMGRRKLSNAKVNGDSFGEHIRRLRKAKGLTQRELAAALDVSERVVSAYERSESDPSFHLIAPLAQNLGVSVDELLGLKPVRNRSTSAMERRWLRKFEEIRRLSGRKQRSIMQVLDMALKTS